MTTRAKAKQAHEPDEPSQVFDRFEIRLSGSGGQGLVLAGVIIAEAVSTLDGKNVVQTQSYGPEARGGASRTDLVVSSGEIYYPKPMALDLLLAMTQESCDLYHHALKDTGILIYDSHLVTQVPFARSVGIPFSQLARHEIGLPMVANVISLGAICAITKIVSEDALTKIVTKRSPRGTEEKNMQALQLGLKVGKETMEGSNL
ncbi:MAG: 2-oxoacid:acceptor oxidoreductase family protein [Candidatus Zixiibacteriota bacterium]